MNVVSTNKVQRAIQEIDWFLHKSGKKNDPLNRISKTKEFASFQSQIKSAIRKQAEWAAENQDSPKLVHMPMMSTLVSEEKVYSFLKFAFEESAKAQYRRRGFRTKGRVDFNLTNDAYISQLKAQGNYLLNQSNIDNLTRNKLIKTIEQGKLDGMTTDELAAEINANFGDISESRSMMIARTETNQATSSADLAVAKENGGQLKAWVVAGQGGDECDDNEADGPIPLDQAFSTGDDAPPAHPNCECYLDTDFPVDLSSVDVWGGE